MKCLVCHHTPLCPLFTSENRHGRHREHPQQTFTLYRCPQCGLIGLPQVQPTPDYYATFYPQGYHGANERPSLVQRAWNRIAASKIRTKANRIAQFLKGPGPYRLLDVGCGPGGFIAQLDATRFLAEGLEPVSEAVQTAQAHGLNVHQGNALTYPFEPEQYDVITLWHVFEHIVDPHTVLKQLNRALKPGGLLVMATPNTDSLAFREGKKYWFHLDSPRHLWLYNPTNLQQLVETSGFRLEHLDYLHFDYPLDLLWSLALAKSPYTPLFPVLKFFDQQNMQLFFRKTEALPNRSAEAMTR